jgi:hypothetical protein
MLYSVRLDKSLDHVCISGCVWDHPKFPCTSDSGSTWISTQCSTRREQYVIVLQVFAWSEKLGSGGWEKKLIHDFKVWAGHTSGITQTIRRSLCLLPILSHALPLHVFVLQTPVWRVSWSVTGALLAVSDASNAVTLWKESVDGLWQSVAH